MPATWQMAAQACVLFQCVPKPSQRLAMPCTLARVSRAPPQVLCVPQVQPQGQAQVYMRQECILTRQPGRSW